MPTVWMKIIQVHVPVAEQQATEFLNSVRIIVRVTMVAGPCRSVRFVVRLGGQIVMGTCGWTQGRYIE